MANNTHIFTCKFKNNSQGKLTGVSFQAAAQKHMTLKMKTASSTSLEPMAADLV